MASFTTLTATMLLSDSDPLSFVTKALFTEKPLSGAALPWERVSAAFPTKPRAGSGVVRMDPLRFLAGCRTRRLNQA